MPEYAAGMQFYALKRAIAYTSRRGAIMAKNMDIDDRLIDEARRLGNHKTSEEAVIAALKEYIDRRKQLEILKHFGTIDYDPDFDIRKMRLLDRIEIEP